MSLRATDELVARALEIAQMSETGTGSAGTLDHGAVLDPILHQIYSLSGTWRMREGQRLRGPRRLVLRLLAPYTERQEELNDALRVAVVLLSREVNRLSSPLDEAASTDSEGAV